MKDFKPAPKPTHKHKNLTQDDLQKLLDQTFEREDNHNKGIWINFDEDYNLDPEETKTKLEQAGYKVTKHANYPEKKMIKIELNS